MKILIVYASVTGTTKECVDMLCHFLRKRTLTVLDLSEGYRVDPSIDLSSYHAVIVGGPIRNAKLHPAVKQFIEENRDLLLQKKTGYFIVGGFADEAEEQLVKSIPKELRDASFDSVYFGGTLDISRQKNWKDRLYIRIMRNSITDTGDNDVAEDAEFTRVLPSINPDTISRFAGKLT